MHHKAFAFDWGRFEAELLPVMKDALSSGDPKQLRSWCRERAAELSDPYEGERLDTDWEQGLENHDVHEYADYALTLFYDPSADFGLDDAWLEIEGQVDSDARAALLGDAVACSGCAFDPGRMGSYFQTPAEVLRSVACLQVLDCAVLVSFANDVETNCAATSLGLYVTF